MYVTGICPHHGDDFDPGGLHKFETKISRFDGKSFSFLRLDTFQGEVRVSSSKGGFANLDLIDAALVDGEQHASRYDFSGRDWKNVKWILLEYGFNFADHEFWRFGNLTFDVNTVAEPGTALLVAGGLTFLAITRRKRRSK